MLDNTFFKPAVLLKEYIILDMIEKNPRITQRGISTTIGIAVSMVNDHLEEFERKGLIKRKKYSTKTVEYVITKKGIERRKVLNIGYFNATQKLYNFAKVNLEFFLHQMAITGYKKLILYGTGEVAQILINTIQSSSELKIEIVALIDDDINKQGKYLNSITIISRNQICDFNHDGILISSYNNRKSMINKLLLQNYDLTKVVNFFDIKGE